MLIKERADATFYHSWYKADHSPALSASDGEHLICSTQTGWDSPSEAQDVIQAVTDLEIRAQPPWSQHSQLLSETQIYPNQFPPESALFSQQLQLSAWLHNEPHLPLPQPSTPSENQPQHWPPLRGSQTQLHKTSTELQGSTFTLIPEVPLTQQRAGEAGITVVENDEEENMQSWVCLPGTVDNNFGLVENSLDFGEGSLDVFSDINDTTLFMQPEASSDNCKLSDGRAEDTEEKEKLEEDHLDVKRAPLLRSSGEGRLKVEKLVKEGIWSDEGRESLEDDLSELEKGTAAIMEHSSKVKNNTLDVGDEVVNSKNTSIQRDRGSNDEAASSEIAEKTQKDREDNEQTQDFDGKMETSVAESEEKITSCVSVQVSVIWFNLHHRHLIIISQALALFTHLLTWLILHTSLLLLLLLWLPLFLIC